MSALGDSRSALDQESGADTSNSVNENRANGNGRTTGLVPGVVVSNLRSSADRREHAVRQPLLFVAAAMAAGIVVDRYWPLAVMAWLAVAAAAICTWFFLARRIAPLLAVATVSHMPNAPSGASTPAAVLAPHPFQTRLMIAAVLLAVAAGGGLWHHLRWRLFAANDLGRFARELPQPVCMEMIALTPPRIRPAPPPDSLRSIQLSASSVLRVRAQALRDGAAWRPVDGQATMTVEGTLLGVKAGDRLRVVGQLQKPVPPGNPGEFDFAAHRRGDRELATIRVDHPDCVQIVEQSPPYSRRRVLGELRAAGDRLLWGTLSHERAGLAAAVLLGAREQLDEEMKDEFLVTGTVHILSISGLHVGILAWVLFKALRTGWISRVPSLIAVGLITLGYTMVTDAEPPAVRATVLVCVACFAIGVGRSPLGINSLSLAAIIVLAINPVDLFRTGTQLSFLSVATLTATALWWQRREKADALTQLIRATRPAPVRWARIVGGEIGALALAGLMIWLVTSPLVAHRFHVVSLSALVLNGLLWLPVLIAMIAGFAVLGVGWLLPPLGALCGMVCDYSLAVVEWSIGAAARLPGSYFWIAGPSQGWLYIYYGLLAAPFLMPRLISHRRGLLLALGWILAGITYEAFGQLRPADRELVCGFVSVGHGSAVVLELPDGQVWLYDAGRLGSPRAAARSVEAYLRSRRIPQIDALILSHADIDHYNAVPELLEKFSVETIYVSPQMFRNDTAPLKILRKAIAKAGVPVVTLSAGHRLVAGDCNARVMHPPTAGVAGNDNAQSLVLCVEFDGRRVLLTGDLESEGARRLLAGPPLDCDILMAPHHGSAHSDPPAVVSWSTPEWAVISSGYSSAISPNTYEPLLGPRALNTAEVGAIRARLSAQRVEIRAWRIEPWE